MSEVKSYRFLKTMMDKFIIGVSGYPTIKQAAVTGRVLVPNDGTDPGDALKLIRQCEDIYSEVLDRITSMVVDLRTLGLAGQCGNIVRVLREMNSNLAE